MATTRLGAVATPERPYGSFEGKAASSGDQPRTHALYTQLGAYGVPRGLYGDFTGKASSGGGDQPRTHALYTQLGPVAIPQGLYGVLTGKATSAPDVVAVAGIATGGLQWVTRYKESEPAVDDDEVAALIPIMWSAIDGGFS